MCLVEINVRSTLVKPAYPQILLLCAIWCLSVIIPVTIAAPQAGYPKPLAGKSHPSPFGPWRGAVPVPRGRPAPSQSKSNVRPLCRELD
jgi:hypothetical protein